MATEIMTFTPPVAEIDARKSRALIIGLVGLALCALGFFLDREHFFRAWLISFWLFLGISLGSLAAVMVQHLTGGQWGVFRRVFEAASRVLPLLAILGIPILLGTHTLYPWANGDFAAKDEILHHRELYLNTGFFVARYVIYFAVWIWFANVLNNLSLRQDSGDVSVNLKLQRLSGAGLVAYGIGVMFAGIDWIMVLNAHWYSTIFGFLTMGGQGLSALAFTILISAFLVRREPFLGFLKPHHFHDLGKLALAFVMLYAYFNFSQYLLTYAANEVEEVPYMVTRIHHGWQFLALFLVVFHFAVPFLFLLNRDLKRRPQRVLWLAAWILFVRWADIVMLVSPEFSSTGPNLAMLGGEAQSHFFIHWLDLAAPLAIGGLWMWMFFTQLANRPLLAIGDPYLYESLQQGSGGH
ncbi:MAG TPA: hypothetical protein VL173_02835 [Vicinamibacterales bacterium]|nr:hypothetical protein [Vicinamibacterales bacterium]